MQESFENRFHRSEILFGSAALQKLKKSRVLLAGAGGVGGYAAEALARGGIGSLTIYDPDNIHYSNLNRQLLALCSNNGQSKASALQNRLKDINPEIELTALPAALTMENIPGILDNGNFDYIVDAIDSVNEKCFLLSEAYARKIPVIAAMGAGCRVDPTQVQYADISKTHGCKLAKTVRSKLKKEYNIHKGITCVFSPESNPHAVVPGEKGERPTIGSSSFMPGIFGLFMAAKVINDLKFDA
jgi:tRNA A37 threonylcarbamoyladenosine dehydratase